MNILLAIKQRRIQRRFIHFSLNDTVRVISAPRKPDGVDGFAGWTGKIISKDVNEYFSRKRDFGSVVIEQEDGATLNIIGLSNVELVHYRKPFLDEWSEMHKENKEGDFWAKCDVCKTVIKNWAGSTPCCGSVAYEVDINGNDVTYEEGDDGKYIKIIKLEKNLT